MVEIVGIIFMKFKLCVIGAMTEGSTIPGGSVIGSEARMNGMPVVPIWFWFPVEGYKVSW